jgi:hypothetical protein
MPRHPPLPVLAEASDWIIVAKPPRLLVHRNWRQPRTEAVEREPRLALPPLPMVVRESAED